MAFEAPVHEQIWLTHLFVQWSLHLTNCWTCCDYFCILGNSNLYSSQTCMSKILTMCDTVYKQRHLGKTKHLSTDKRMPVVAGMITVILEHRWHSFESTCPTGLAIFWQFLSICTQEANVKSNVWKNVGSQFLVFVEDGRCVCCFNIVNFRLYNDQLWLVQMRRTTLGLKAEYILSMLQIKTALLIALVAISRMVGRLLA